MVCVVIKTNPDSALPNKYWAVNRIQLEPKRPFHASDATHMEHERRYEARESSAICSTP